MSSERRSSEHERIGALRSIFAAASTDVRVGIGDDAAVLAPSTGGRTVVSVDAHVEGVHFTRALMPLRDAGWRATMAALSDLAAMGARPVAVFSALGLPRSMTDADLFEVAEGQAEAARAAGTTIAGGNLTTNPILSITTTVVGEAAIPVLRSGARAGDVVLLGGEVGWSAAGLALLRRGEWVDGGAGDFARAVAAFRRPVARLELGVAAARADATSLIDVSDGVAADAAHVAAESGVDICLDLASLDDPALASVLGVESAEDVVLGGGEDFALLATAPPGVEIAGMRRVGVCRAVGIARTAGSTARPVAPAVYGVRDGVERRLVGLGFDHFRG